MTEEVVMADVNAVIVDLERQKSEIDHTIRNLRMLYGREATPPVSQAVSPAPTPATRSQRGTPSAPTRP